MVTRKVDPELVKRLRSAPGASHRLIVGVRGDLDTRAAEVGARGVAVHLKLALIGALAIEATGSQALALSAEPWVSRIELDREVRAAAQR